MYDFDAIRTVMQAAGYGNDAQSIAAENQAITAAWIELSGEREWSFLRKRATGGLTIGVATVTSPADLAVPKTLFLSDTATGYLMEQVSADHLQQRLDLDIPASTGVPYIWAWVRNTILVYPKPQAAYTTTLDYVKVPVETDFDANNEVLPFSDGRFAPVIAWGAMRWMAIRQRDAASYQIYAAEYTAAKAQFEQADRRGEPDKVVDWDGWTRAGM